MFGYNSKICQRVLLGISPVYWGQVKIRIFLLIFQIGGTTLHSFAGIGAGTAVISRCVQLAERATVAKQWRKCKHLIIDEVVK